MTLFPPARTRVAARCSVFRTAALNTPKDCQRKPTTRFRRATRSGREQTPWLILLHASQGVGYAFLDFCFEHTALSLMLRWLVQVPRLFQVVREGEGAPLRSCRRLERLSAPPLFVPLTISPLLLSSSVSGSAAASSFNIASKLNVLGRAE
jgi:hypothetical protein